MKVTKSVFTFLLAAAVTAGVAFGQSSIMAVDEEIAMLESAVQQLEGELKALERALEDQGTIVWETADGWQAASVEELEQRVSFLQLVETRMENKQQSGRLAGLDVPESLAQMVYDDPGRPARRLVRQWSEAQVPAAQKMSSYRQDLNRNVRLAQRWLADSREQRAAMARPLAAGETYPEGRCWIPPGRWQVGKSDEVLEIERVSFRLIATKTRGSSRIPAGGISFFIDPRTCDAGLQQADEGQTNVRWVRGRVDVAWVEKGSQFSIDWPERKPQTYTRVD